MAGTTIPLLPSATTPLDGTELIIVEQGGVTKKSTITAGQQIALDAANTAQSTANSAASDASAASSAASAAQTTANSAASAAATAQSTANGKLSTVAVDGITVTGNGTVGNPLIANVPTLYQQITKSAFTSLVASNDLVIGKSYLVEDAYLSSVYSTNFYILVTAISTNNISNLSWVKYFDTNPDYNCFLKCRTDVSFSFMHLYETCIQLFLNQTACQAVIGGANEFVQGCNIFVSIGGTVWKTTIGNSPGEIVVKNVLNIDSGTSMYGILGELNINANTYILYSTPSYKSYVAMITQSGTSAPVATVMKNELSAPIVFTRGGGGVYIGTLAGAFTANKTYATISQTSYQATAIIGFYPGNINIFQISVLTSAPAGIDSEINQAMLEIRVYN
jgi:hypothetical protein